MPVTISGSGTITGIATGGLPDGSIASSDLADNAVTAGKLASSLDLTGKTVTLPSGTGGKVLQVQYNSTTSTGTLAHTGDTDIPHSYLTVDITPVSQTSIIYVSYHLFGEWGNTGFYEGTAFLSRRVGGTHNYLRAPAAGNRRTGLTVAGFVNYPGTDANSTPEPILLMQYPDDHNQTGTITYFPATQVAGSYNWYYNQTVEGSDIAARERGVSWIMAMEVGS